MGSTVIQFAEKELEGVVGMRRERRWLRGDKSGIDLARRTFIGILSEARRNLEKKTRSQVHEEICTREREGLAGETWTIPGPPGIVYLCSTKQEETYQW